MLVPSFGHLCLSQAAEGPVVVSHCGPVLNDGAGISLDSAQNFGHLHLGRWLNVRWYFLIAVQFWMMDGGSHHGWASFLPLFSLLTPWICISSLSWVLR